jgi:ADP-heptose:LPS heptosyltransferase
LPNCRNILLVRTDRIGDVVLSLPTAALLKEHFPAARITFLAREYTAPLIALSDVVDGVINDRPESPAWMLAADLKSCGFDLAVILHPTGRLAWATWLAGIPVRIGTAYRAYSLLFNRRIRQHRRFSLKHELEHNLDLVRSGLGLEPSPGREYQPKLTVPPELRHAVAARLGGVIDVSRTFVAVHPGSGGSARDWPLENFAALIDQVQQSGVPAAVTLGPEEGGIKASLKKLLQTEPAWISGLTLPEMAAFLSRAKLLVANSTGPLHIATAVGTRTVGLYCPMIPCHPKRWGPYGPGQQTLLPPGVQPCRRCIADKCPAFDCMRKITVAEVSARVAQAVKQSPRKL